MRTHNSNIIFFLLFTLLIISPLESSQEIEQLEFHEALELSFEHNPQMVEARKEIDTAQGELITSRALQNPEAEFEVGGFKKDDNGEREINLGSFEIKQPFDPVGVKFYQNKMASLQVKIQNEGFRSVWASVYKEVRESYSKIVFDVKLLELARDNLNAMRQFFGRVQQKYQSGQVLKNDFQRAKIELLRAEHAYLSAVKELKVDKARLNLSLGRPMETEFDIVEKLQEEHLNTSMDQLKAVALANRPDIKSAHLELESKKQNVIKEKLNRLPSYSVGFQRTDEEYEDDYAIVVGVSLPLWSFNHGEVKKAKAEEYAQTIRTQAVENEALFDVYVAYLDAELAQRQFELAKKSLDEANELLRLANLHYSEGEINFLNYLDQVKTAAQTKTSYYESLFHLSRSMSILESSIYASLRQEEFFNEKF